MRFVLYYCKSKLEICLLKITERPRTEAAMITLDQLTLMFWVGGNSTLEEFDSFKKRQGRRAGPPVPISRAVFLLVIHTAGKLSDAQGHIGNAFPVQKLGLPWGTLCDFSPSHPSSFVAFFPQDILLSKEGPVAYPPVSFKHPG